MREKRWIVTRYPRPGIDLCDHNMAQGWIDFDQPFQSGHQAPLGHINCRCILQVRWLTGPELL